MAARHAFTVPMHAVKFLYTATFHWGLKVATHCCVVVHQCFIQDQPDTTEISQIQLPSRVPNDLIFILQHNDVFCPSVWCDSGVFSKFRPRASLGSPIARIATPAA